MFAVFHCSSIGKIASHYYNYYYNESLPIISYGDNKKKNSEVKWFLHRIFTNEKRQKTYRPVSSSFWT